jgi:glucan phosphoethanolaminetransferase (alkaline phosphatase superfamily)
MHRSAFRPALVLGLLFVAAKTVLAWPHVHDVKSLDRVVGASAEDVLAAIVFGAVGTLILRATARWRVANRVTWWGVIVLGAVAAAYAFVNVGIFKAVGQPLSARMIALVGRFGDLRSSITAHSDVGLAAATVAAGLAMLAFVHPRLAGGRPHGAAAVVLMVAATVWVGCGMALRARAEPDSWVRVAGQSPHRVMVASIASWAFSDRRLNVAGPFPPEYLDDFKPAVERPRPALPQFARPPRNVILVVLESTAARYLSVYGSPHDTTPNLVAESRNALVFDRFYANVGYTYRSMVPLVFSVYPGLPWSYRSDMDPPIPPGLAGVLKGRGYRTAFLAAANPEWGGMDWMATTAGAERVLGPAELGGPSASSWGTEDGVLIDGLVRWIDADRSRPFFAVAWTDQTHDPYTLDAGTKPVDFLDETKVRHGDLLERYLNALRQADRHLGRLFEALRSRGLADDTLVVITGDHGEAFGDVHEVFSHGTGMFDECQRVPLILWNPRLFAGGRRDAQRVGAHVDLNPTLAHVLGVDPPATWQGASLFSPDHPGRAYMLTDLAGYQFAVTDGRYKYVLHPTGGFERLYDLRDDPLEQRDESKNRADVAGRMRARISAFVHAEEAYLEASKRR